MRMSLQQTYVGLEVTREAPFVVLQVDDLCDQHGVMQGEPGYSNEAVLVDDCLLSVDGYSVERLHVELLHELLGGPADSTVDLGLARPQLGGMQKYIITVKRHALHRDSGRGGQQPQPGAAPELVADNCLRRGFWAATCTVWLLNAQDLSSCSSCTLN